MKKYITDTGKLFWDFKWSVLVYALFYALFIMDYLNPPAADNPMFGAEHTREYWYYLNQEVYIENLKHRLIIFLLLFLVGTSNMRNHPLLARIIFLSPLFILIVNLITAIAR